MSETVLKRSSAPPSLKGAPWLKHPETERVFAALAGPGLETRAVGGAVRNTLLGLPVTEIDLATTALPHRVMELARKAGLKAVPTGIDHGTVTVIADGVPFEVTTLRRDVETFGRHASVAFTEDWQEDARRRDFTLNALYAESDGTVFDPLGGYDDVVAGRVRFIGDAEARIKEDYLRILRFFRFNAYFGKAPFDAPGLEASVKLRNGLERLSAERIAGEVRRLLVAPQAGYAVEALFDYGLLTGVIGAVPRLGRFRRLVAIEEALGRKPDAMLRLAALAVFVTEDAERVAKRLHLSNAEQAVLALGADDYGHCGLPEEGAAKRLLYRLGPAAYSGAVLMAWAESDGPPNDQRWRDASTLGERWQAPVFPIKGSDLAALCGVKGPALGTLLRRLETEWVAEGFTASPDALLERAVAVSRRSSKQGR
jgi:poly(A) polymerase